MGIRVFISYSHDSPEHEAAIWNLSERLRADGLDCIIDQHVVNPPGGWTRWCLDRIEEAEFVLVACTAIYHERYRGKVVGAGLGANWEGFVISQEIYDSEMKTTKFVPVTFRSEDLVHIPRELRAATHFVLKSDRVYTSMLRLITNQPERIPSPVSPTVPILPTHLGALPTPSPLLSPPASVTPIAVAAETAAVGALEGSHTIKVYISQHFRIADLLIYPESARTSGFANVINDAKKLSRAIRTGRKYPIGSLGQLYPVADKFEDFWRTGIPDLKRATTQQLWFLPFGLDLTDYFASQQLVPHSILNEILGEAGGDIVNKQVSCRLRIYPPGVGVVRIGIVLSFRQNVLIEPVTRIVQDLEDAFFPRQAGDPCKFVDVLVQIIDEVADALFREQKTTGAGRRWRPPETAYYVHDDDHFSPARNTAGMAKLMSQTPGNEEQIEALERRLDAAVTTPHWQNAGLLAVSGEKVVMLCAERGSTPINKLRRQKEIHSLLETAEIVSAGVYSERQLVEKLSEISGERSLDDDWPEERGDKIEFLSRLLSMLRMVLQAIASARLDIPKRGIGVLMPFASAIWWQNHPSTQQEFQEALSYVDQWCRKHRIQASNQHTDHSPDARLDEILSTIQEIHALSQPFRAKR
jgi:hypothetical protein